MKRTRHSYSMCARRPAGLAVDRAVGRRPRLQGLTTVTVKLSRHDYTRFTKWFGSSSATAPDRGLWWTFTMWEEPPPQEPGANVGPQHVDRRRLREVDAGQQPQQRLPPLTGFSTRTGSRCRRRARAPARGYRLRERRRRRPARMPDVGAPLRAGQARRAREVASNRLFEQLPSCRALRAHHRLHRAFVSYTASQSAVVEVARSDSDTLPSPGGCGSAWGEVGSWGRAKPAFSVPP
jgi:hypothetical protein